MVSGSPVATGRRHGARPPRARQRARRAQAATGFLLALALERFTQVLHVVPPRTVLGLGHAGVAVLFRVLTGLADGLALKELALRANDAIRPNLSGPPLPDLPRLHAPKEELSGLDGAPLYQGVVGAYRRIFRPRSGCNEVAAVDAERPIRSAGKRAATRCRGGAIRGRRPRRRRPRRPARPRRRPARRASGPGRARGPWRSRRG